MLRRVHHFFRLLSGKSENKEKRILIIDHQVPLYDKDAGSLRMCKILKILRESGYSITFIGEQKNEETQYYNCIEENGMNIFHFSSFRKFKYYMKLKRNSYDIVILSRLHIAEKYIQYFKKEFPHAKIIFDTVDLSFLRLYRMAKVENNSELFNDAKKIESSTLHILRLVHAIWVTSPFEMNILRSYDPDLNIEIVPIIYDIQKTSSPFIHRKNLLFVGSFLHSPNIDAILWFIREIFPIIHEKIPDIILFVVGENPPEIIMALHSEGIVVTGYSQDLTRYFEQCRVFIAPLRYGAGVKGKIAQSMSYGLPVVSTSTGAEGMYLIDGENALITDDPEEFAQKCIDIYSNELLWNKISTCSKMTFEKNFSYSVCKDKIATVIESIMKGD